jgi:hypothetical protein
MPDKLDKKMVRTQIQQQKSSSAKAFDPAQAGMVGFYLIHSAYFRRMTGGGQR